MGTMKKAGFEQLLTKHPGYTPNIYIETGLMAGDRFVIAAECFKRVHGIELDAHWYGVCKDRVRKMPNVSVHHGDTRIVLPKLIEEYRNTSCVFYLDAHFCLTNPPIQKSEFPLWVELEAIKARKTKDIVLVDDVHTFGLSRPELRFKPDAREWESVTKESILEFFGKQTIDSMELEDSFVVWRDGQGCP